MPFQDIGWISDLLHGRDICFPNDTVWRLTEVLSEKNVYFDDDPAEASAMFDCKQLKGQKPGCEAVIRVRMQYGTFRLCHLAYH